MHGTRMLTWQELRLSYGRELISLRNEPRFNFLNTLFSVSEALMYMQVKPYLIQGSQSRALFLFRKLVTEVLK